MGLLLQRAERTQDGGLGLQSWSFGSALLHPPFCFKVQPLIMLERLRFKSDGFRPWGFTETQAPSGLRSGCQGFQSSLPGTGAQRLRFRGSHPKPETRAAKTKQLQSRPSFRALRLRASARGLGLQGTGLQLQSLWAGDAGRLGLA